MVSGVDPSDPNETYEYFRNGGIGWKLALVGDHLVSTKGGRLVGFSVHDGVPKVKWGVEIPFSNPKSTMRNGVVGLQPFSDQHVLCLVSEFDTSKFMETTLRVGILDVEHPEEFRLLQGFEKQVFVSGWNLVALHRDSADPRFVYVGHSDLDCLIELELTENLREIHYLSGAPG